LWKSEENGLFKGRGYIIKRFSRGARTFRGEEWKISGNLERIWCSLQEKYHKHTETSTLGQAECHVNLEGLSGKRKFLRGIKLIFLFFISIIGKASIEMPR
jgi:hypothetical protein